MPVIIKAQEEGVGGQHQGKFQGTAPGKVSEDISRESFRGERQEKFQRAVPGKVQREAPGRPWGSFREKF